MRHSFVSLAVALAIGPLSAQQDGFPGTPNVELQQARAEKPVFTGKALPGTRAGTERWIVHFEKEPYSLDAYQAEMWGDRDPAKVEVLVKDIEARMKAGRKGFVADVEALGGTVLAQWWIVNALAIEIAPKHLATIGKLDNVAYLQPDLEVSPQIKTATNSANHNSDSLNAARFTGANVGVAIIDTSFDDNMNGSGKPHITFSRRGSTTVNRFCHKQKVGSRPFDDPHRHGTGVASIAAGWRWRTSTADNGHAYDAAFACFSISNASNGNSSTSTMAAAYNAIAAIAAKCRIKASNLSYSGSSNPLSVEQKAMDNLALRSDILNATAAGNAGSNVSSSLANINGLSVAAVNENSHTLAGFSSRGNQGGRYFPNIAANGVSTNMARQNSETSDYIASGTSMASPQVCGGAALIRGINTALRSDETRALLLASTKASSGTSSTIKVYGPGAGYMKLDVARTIAQNAARHGRATMTRVGQIITKTFNLRTGQTLQFAIAWHRHNVNSTSWSNLDLTLKRGATVLVRSDTRLNTEEFVRYRATSNQTVTVEIRLVTFGSGARSQAFGWATNLTPGTTKPGLYVKFGTGCKGSGGGSGGSCTVLPRAYATKMGNTANTFPHARANMRYQQVFLGSEIGGRKTWTELCLRLDEQFGGPAQSQRLEVRYGDTTANLSTIGTNFDGNYRIKGGTLFNGTLNLPTWNGGGKVNDFKVCVKFSKPAPWGGATTVNLIIEIINRSTSARSHFEDYASGTGVNTTRLYAFSASASTATSKFVNQGLIMCLKSASSSGANPVLSNSGVPVIGKTFAVTLASARVNAPALLYLGRRTSAPLPGGCTLYATPDVLMGVRTATGGTASLTIGIPNIKVLVGVKFANQWWVIDPQGALLNFAALSNGGEGTVGG